ncbi:hypothetical protein H2198_009220 [Neophaeococcomyces mojaviensis]|uniref:Uncharacterized protein n=1 Tax=Neophaeococcomyces mojaviensis TaxID=3383035 RepID=A0ACC2ZV34_9EURO|nr:hypothetical protein H2198_009220 [Knufia sp. JES_112]
MSRPTLKRGRLNAEFQDSEARPCKKHRIMQQESQLAPLIDRFQIPQRRKMDTSKHNAVEFDHDKNIVKNLIRINLNNQVHRYQDDPVKPSARNRLYHTVQEGISDQSSNQAKANDESSMLLVLWAKHDNLDLQSLIEEYTRAELDKDTNQSIHQNADEDKQQRNSFLEDTKPPLSSIEKIFDDIANKAIELGFLEACMPFQKQGLQLITMCSGTESPVIALQLLQDAIESKDVENRGRFTIKHVASAEIEPFKQGYIQRNFEPPILFRDVTEFNDRHALPHTAFGGVAPQPDKVHMLVAGSSCVDYSSLNAKTKHFGEAGQSYSTFMGIISYAEWAKPPIVVLENVDSAPWGQMIDSLKIIGYVGICFKVDSKDFYIPQTRQRGYIVAFHEATAKEKGFNLKETFITLHEALKKFASRASAPFTDFIFADDDPELFITRRLLANPERNATSNKQIAWTACRHRYSAYRAAKELGPKKPYTNWRPDGKCVPPDFGWVD